MRHRIHGRKLSRSPAHRRSLRRNLARSLFDTYGERGYIVTTRQKAKFAQPFVEKLISLGRQKTLHNYRRGLQLLGDEDMVHKLFEEIGPAYLERPGGYTRILRTNRRRLGDGGVEVLFGFVQDADEEEVAVTADAVTTDAVTTDAVTTDAGATDAGAAQDGGDEAAEDGAIDASSAEDDGAAESEAEDGDEKK